MDTPRPRYHLRPLRNLPVRALLAARRTAVASGELRCMWPGAAWDIATLVWFRGICAPIIDRLVPVPIDRYHSPDGDCPLCNPPRSYGRDSFTV